ncbi:MAG TPA: L-fucose:H+ symporter permease [Candidatus Sulfotelmatobacter sp.]|nr:L-fucose:H+ symporter permease [Candidatus Sulfotelmatobacter sp.]
MHVPAAEKPDRSNSVKHQHPLFPAGHLVPFVLVTALFFLWGIPNNLNDVLIRHFMKSFAITRFKAGLVQSAFYMGYFLLAMPAALLMRKAGYKTGFVIGLLLYGSGCFLFWPAAIAGSYGFFLFALFVIASGLSFLETASNPFIAQLGDPETSERRLNFSQAFNPLGAISGALIGTVFIFSGVELSSQDVAARKAQGLYEAYLRTETLRVIKPYLVIGAVAIFWALVILRTKFPAIQSEHESSSGDHGHFKELFRYPHFLWAVLAQFLYVGAQVGTWSYFIQYVQESTHQPEKIAGYFLTGTLAAFGVGRFASAYLMRTIAPNKLMGAYSVVNIALVFLGVLFPGWLGLWCVFLTSFFMSLMFPTIFALGLKGLGPNTKIGGSLLVMAIVGGAVLTPLMGLISEAAHSIAVAYLVPLVSYIVIALYSFFGSKQATATS